MTALWHYTCEHGHRDLLADPYVRPVGAIPGVDAASLADLPADLARFGWFTDLDVPMVDVLGLTRRTIACDRTQYRFRATAAGDVTPWTAVRRAVDVKVRRSLEGAHGAMPRHWYVSERPVPVVLDQTGLRLNRR